MTVEVCSQEEIKEELIPRFYEKIKSDFLISEDKENELKKYKVILSKYRI